MLQQLGGLWRWLQDQSPARQAIILAAPIVAMALLVLGGLIVWRVAAPLVSKPTSVTVQPTFGPATAPASPAPAESPAPAAKPQSSPVPVLPSPSPQPVLVPTVGPTPTPAPTSTPAPTATPTPPPARSARVVDTEGQGANMRRSASVSAQRVKVIPEGTIVELVGGETRGDGYTWRNVRDVDGQSGFVIADYLQPIQAAPGATAVLPPPSIQVDEITSPIARGGEGTLTIITRPGERCEVRVLVFGPATLPRDGLETRTADKDGICSWTWKVPPEVVPGTWRYLIFAGEGESRSQREVPFVVT